MFSYPMRREQSAVRDFHVLANQPYPSRPTFPDEATQELRLKLVREEALTELEDAFAAKDIVLVADAIADALYVVLGTAVACGIDIEPIFHEVQRSNMSKFIDGTRREDGKWVKGPSYTPAEIKPLIDAQLNPFPWAAVNDIEDNANPL